MAVDPKLVGGGAAVVAIGGGSGYAISQAASNKTDENSGKTGQQAPGKDNPKAPTPEQNKTTNKAALTASGFQVDNTKENTGNCKIKLEGKVLSTEDDFKEVVKECVINKKFADKATLLGLDVLKSDNQENGGTEGSGGTTNKDSITPIITSTSSSNNGSDVKTNVVNFCTQTGTGKGNKDINENATDDDGKKFLKACTKDKTPATSGKETREVILTKDFGTGAVSTTSTDRSA